MSNRFLTIEDLTNLPQPQWLIEGMFESKSLIMLAGPSYSFKSFLLLDWMLCLVTGRNWNGKKTLPCKVVYALGEGKSNILKRILAWTRYHDISPEEKQLIIKNFRITFDVPQLASKASTDNFLADLNKEGYQPDLIGIDTFARSFVGSDENDAKDTGLWIESADRLRQLGFGVIFLHHTKKNTEFGLAYRGSTAVMGAMDTGMTLSRSESYCTLEINKQKDHDELKPMRFRRLLIGDSCVLVPAPIIDERFSEEEPSIDINQFTEQLLKDDTFDTDVSRAKEISKRFNISEGAAKIRVNRARVKQNV